MVKNNYVNVRTGPSIRYPLVTKISRSEIINKIDEAKDAKNRIWYQIQTSEGQTGWVFANYLEILPNDSTTKARDSYPSENLATESNIDEEKENLEEEKDPVQLFLTEDQPLPIPSETASTAPQDEYFLEVGKELEQSKSSNAQLPEKELLNSSLKIFTGLCLVLGLILLVAFLIRKIFGKRLGVSSSANLLKVLATCSIAPRHSVSLLEVPGRLLVISISPEGSKLLCQIKDPQTIRKIHSSEAGSLHKDFDDKNFKDHLDLFSSKLGGSSE